MVTASNANKLHARGIVPRGIVGCAAHGERWEPFEARGTEKKCEAAARSSNDDNSIININYYYASNIIHRGRMTRLDSSGFFWGGARFEWEMVICARGKSF